MVEVISKTALYDGLSGLPPLVERAVELSRRMGFISSCAPAQGRLLQVLAAGRDGGSIGETGTGCGVGLAWMVSAVGTSTRLISIERDPERAAACRARSRLRPNRICSGSADRSARAMPGCRRRWQHPGDTGRSGRMPPRILIPLLQHSSLNLCLLFRGLSHSLPSQVEWPCSLPALGNRILIARIQAPWSVEPEQST